MSTPHDTVHPLLVTYLSGMLDPGMATVVAEHVASCTDCRQELASWRQIEQVWREASQVSTPPIHALEVVVRQIAAAEHQAARQAVPLRWRATYLLLQQQVRVLHRGFWLASAVLVVLGWGIAVSTPAASAGLMLQLVAPLVAAFGVSMMYHPAVEPFLEVVRATPTSPRLLLLTRLTIVCGYDLLLVTAASWGLAAIHPGSSLWTLIAGWFGPMLFLAAFALLLAQRWGATGGMAAAWSVWILRVLLAANDHVGILSPALALQLSSYWSTNFLTLGCAALLGVIAFAHTSRESQTSWRLV